METILQYLYRIPDNMSSVNIDKTQKKLDRKGSKGEILNKIDKEDFQEKIKSQYDVIARLGDKNETLNDEIQKLRKEKAILEKEKDEALSRLSQLAGQKLTQGNPAITDPNRPAKVGERWSSLYTDEWTDAYEDINSKSISTDGEQSCPEKQLIEDGSEISIYNQRPTYQVNMENSSQTPVLYASWSSEKEKELLSLREHIRSLESTLVNTLKTKQEKDEEISNLKHKCGQIERESLKREKQLIDSSNRDNKKIQDKLQKLLLEHENSESNIFILTNDNKRHQIQIKTLLEEEDDLQKQIKDQLSLIHQQQEEIETMKKENQSLHKQLNNYKPKLSQLAGQKLTQGNPAITDLGNPNRPAKVGEGWSLVYTDEWMDAYEDINRKSISTDGEQSCQEKQLKEIVDDVPVTKGVETENVVNKADKKSSNLYSNQDHRYTDRKPENEENCPSKNSWKEENPQTFMMHKNQETQPAAASDQDNKPNVPQDSKRNTDERKQTHVGRFKASVEDIFKSPKFSRSLSANVKEDRPALYRRASYDVLSTKEERRPFCRQKSEDVPDSKRTNETNPDGNDKYEVAKKVNIAKNTEKSQLKNTKYYVKSDKEGTKDTDTLKRNFEKVVNVTSIRRNLKQLSKDKESVA